MAFHPDLVGCLAKHQSPLALGISLPQLGDHVYAAANTKVGKIRKRDGQLVDTYKAGEGLASGTNVGGGGWDKFLKQ